MEEIVVNQMSRYVLDGVYFAWKTYCRDQLELRLLKQNIFAMEMIKQLRIAIRQDRLFGDVLISRIEPPSPPAA